MSYKQLLNGLVTAAISGGTAATAQIVLDPATFNFKRTGAVFAAGAVIGVFNWLRRNPWHPADPDPDSKELRDAADKFGSR